MEANNTERITCGAGIAVILCVFAVVGMLYASYIPAWQPYDEPFHFLYAQKILHEGRLPDREKNYQSVHPPAYYALAAAAAYPLRDREYRVQLMWLRRLNVLLGVAALWILYLTALEAGWSRGAARGAAALGASVPMLSVCFASVTNDNLAIALAWAAIYCFCRMARRRVTTGRVALAALVSGLAFGTKSNNAFLVPMFALFYAAYAGRRKFANIARDAAAFIAVFVPSGLWWHVYAFIRYGNQVFGNPVSEPAPFAFWLPANFVRWLEMFFGTFWLFVDFLRNKMPHRPEMIFYIIFIAATLILAAGMVRALASPGENGAARRRIAVLLLCGFALAVCEIFAYNRLSFVGTARYAFPALSGLLIVWAWGAERMFGRRGEAALWFFFVAVTIINLVLIFRYVGIMPPVPFSVTPAML